MPSIQFDGTEIVSTTYVPRYIKHESAPDRMLDIVGLAKEDGAVLISEKYNTKRIVVAGNIKANTQTALETAIDTFKELFSRNEKNLDIGWAGGTRRYVATCERHDFDRDYMHIGFVPWVAEFIVPSGVGKDTATTAAINATSVNTSPYTSSVTLGGTAEPKPIITLTVGAGCAATVLGFSFENTDTDEKIVVNYASGFSNTDVIEINRDEKTVELNGESIAFHGIFPNFIIGSNNFEINAGRIVDQQFGDGSYDSQSTPGETVYVAQSFIVPEKDTTYKTVQFYGLRLGSPGNVTIEIQTDSNGEPSGVSVTNGSMTVADNTITTSNAWQTVEFTNAFTLESNTRYWIVISVVSSDASNYIAWRYGNGTNATYKRGNGTVSANSGSTWTDYSDRDYLFKVCYGGIQDTTPDLTLDIDYYKKYL